MRKGLCTFHHASSLYHPTVGARERGRRVAVLRVPRWVVAGTTTLGIQGRSRGRVSTYRFVLGLVFLPHSACASLSPPDAVLRCSSPTDDHRAATTRFRLRTPSEVAPASLTWSHGQKSTKRTVLLLGWPDSKRMLSKCRYDVLSAIYIASLSHTCCLDLFIPPSGTTDESYDRKHCRSTRMLSDVKSAVNNGVVSFSVRDDIVPSTPICYINGEICVNAMVCVICLRIAGSCLKPVTAVVVRNGWYVFALPGYTNCFVSV